MKSSSDPSLHRIDIFDSVDDNQRGLDVAILTLHGGEPEPFLETFEDFLNICYLTADELLRLCRSEMDTFSPELATFTAMYLSAQGYRVGVFRALVPREIIDSNRVPGQGVKAMFDFERHKDWHTRFVEIHREVLRQKDIFLSQLRKGGRLLDLHSMHPYCPKEPIKSPGANAKELVLPHLRKRLHALAEPKKWGQRRSVCVITETRNGNGVREQIADPLLAEKVGKAMMHLGVAENYPYHGRPDIESVNSMKVAQGVAVDVPKDLMSKETVESGFDLASLTPDIDCIKEIGQKLSQATSDTIQQDETV